MAIQQLMIAQGRKAEKLYWRIFILGTANSPISDGAAAMAELGFRVVAGGSSVATGGTASALETYVTLSAANAFDGNPATLWGSSANARLNNWVKYAFPTPVDIVEVAITARNDAVGYGVSQTPNNFKIQSSQDNSTWTDVWTVASTGAWADGETKVFTKP